MYVGDALVFAVIGQYKRKIDIRLRLPLTYLRARTVQTNFNKNDIFILSTRINSSGIARCQRRQNEYKLFINF